MKKQFLMVLLCVSLLPFVAGCVPIGAENSFCLPEESIQNDSLFGGEMELVFDGAPTVATSVWDSDKKAYQFVCIDKDENGNEQTFTFTAQFFKYDSAYYADIEGDDPEAKAQICMHYPMEVGVIGGKLVFLVMNADLPTTVEELNEFGKKYPLRYEVAVNSESNYISNVCFSGESKDLQPYLSTLFHATEMAVAYIPRDSCASLSTGMGSSRNRAAFLTKYLTKTLEAVQREGMSAELLASTLEYVELLCADDETWKKISKQDAAKIKKIYQKIMLLKPEEKN